MQVQSCPCANAMLALLKGDAATLRMTGPGKNPVGPKSALEKTALSEEYCSCGPLNENGLFLKSGTSKR